MCGRWGSWFTVGGIVHRSGLLIMAHLVDCPNLGLIVGFMIGLIVGPIYLVWACCKVIVFVAILEYSYSLTCGPDVMLCLCHTL